MTKKFFTGLLVALVVFALAEGVLWICGVVPPIASEVPALGFSGRLRLFEREGDSFETRIAGNSRTFNAESFRAEKPANGIRIFCLGGSSAYGFPRGASEAFSGVLLELLSAAYPEKAIEVINVAGVSYAMHRVNLVFDEIAEYDPDIVIIYSGHNEFVETAFFEKAKTESGIVRQATILASHLRLYGLLKKPLDRYRVAKRPLSLDVDREFDLLFTEEQKREIAGRYKEGLRRLVVKAHAKGIRPVVCTVPCNLREWPPFKSHRFGTLSVEDEKKWNFFIREARELLERSDAEGAIREAEVALRFASDHAATHYLLGKAHEARGDYARAKEAYALACDLDAFPQRRLSAIDEAIRDVAREEKAVLVDVERAFEAQSEHGMIGFNLIEDYVHPTVEGHQQIAKLLWGELKTAGLIPESTSNEESIFEQVVSARSTGTPTDNPVWLYNQGCIMQAQGLRDEAVARFRQALLLEPRYPAAAVNLAVLLDDAGKSDEATGILNHVLAYDPGHKPAGDLLKKIKAAK